MVKKGDIIGNPVTGERIIFIETSKDSDGKFLKYDYFMKPNAPAAPEHLHPFAEEKFEVIRGCVLFRINGSERRADLGDVVIIPAGTRHTGWNNGDEEIYLRAEISPAMKFEDYYATCFELANEGKTDIRGLPNCFQLAVFGYEMKDQAYLPNFIWAQKLFFNIVGPIAKLFGYRSVYNRKMQVKAKTHERL